MQGLPSRGSHSLCSRLLLLHVFPSFQNAIREGSGGEPTAFDFAHIPHLDDVDTPSHIFKHFLSDGGLSALLKTRFEPVSTLLYFARREWPSFMMIVAGTFFRTCSMLASPLILEQFMSVLEEGEANSSDLQTRGGTLVALLFCVYFLNFFAWGPTWEEGTPLAMRSMASFFAIGAAKTFVLARGVNRPANADQLLGKFSTILVDLDVFTWANVYSWAALIQVAFGWWRISMLLGAASGAAAVSSLVAVVFLSMLTRSKSKVLESRAKKEKTKRVSLTQELLANFRDLRAIGWVDWVRSRVLEVREREIGLIAGGARLRSIVDSISTLSTPIAATVAFLVFTRVNAGATPSAAESFAALTWLVFLTNPVKAVPDLLQRYNDAFIYLNEMDKLMRKEEAPLVQHSAQWDGRLSRPSAGSPPASLGGAPDLLEIVGIDVCVNQHGKVRPLVHGITVSVAAKEAVFVVGPNGAGKTRLLRAIVADSSIRMRTTSSKFLVHARTAYVSQDAKLQSGSIRSNVRGLYAQSWGLQDCEEHDAWYIEAMNACGLLPDRQLGDEADVGKLSGGQHARVALARAVFAAGRPVSAEHGPALFVIDDVFAPLDPVTRDAVFSRCLSLLLANGHGVIIASNETKFATDALISRVLILDFDEKTPPRRRGNCLPRELVAPYIGELAERLEASKGGAPSVMGSSLVSSPSPLISALVRQHSLNYDELNLGESADTVSAVDFAVRWARDDEMLPPPPTFDTFIRQGPTSDGGATYDSAGGGDIGGGGAPLQSTAPTALEQLIHSFQDATTTNRPLQATFVPRAVAEASDLSKAVDEGKAPPLPSASAAYLSRVSLLLGILLVLLFIASQMLLTVQSLWLKHWASQDFDEINSAFPWVWRLAGYLETPSQAESSAAAATLYNVLSVAIFSLVFARQMLHSAITIHVSRAMHDEALKAWCDASLISHVMKSQKKRPLTRFEDDLDRVDSYVRPTTSTIAGSVFAILGSIVLLFFSAWQVMFPVVAVFAVIYLYAGRAYKLVVLRLSLLKSSDAVNKAMKNRWSEFASRETASLFRAVGPPAPASVLAFLLDALVTPTRAALAYSAGNQLAGNCLNALGNVLVLVTATGALFLVYSGVISSATAALIVNTAYAFNDSAYALISNLGSLDKNAASIAHLADFCDTQKEDASQKPKLVRARLSQLRSHDMAPADEAQLIDRASVRARNLYLCYNDDLPNETPPSAAAAQMQTPLLSDDSSKDAAAPTRKFDLDGASFDIEAGAKVAVVGVTGVGKSSVFQAILRLTPHESGGLYIGGRDMALISQAAVARADIVSVPQGGFVLSGTIRENLLGPLQDLLSAECGLGAYWDDSRIIAFVGAAVCPSLRARIERDKLQLSAHLSTSDGSGAQKNDDDEAPSDSEWSRGERALLSVARALLALDITAKAIELGVDIEKYGLTRARVILLDEPASDVDADSKRTLFENLRKRAETVLCIVHPSIDPAKEDELGFFDAVLEVVLKVPGKSGACCEPVRTVDEYKRRRDGAAGRVQTVI